VLHFSGGSGLAVFETLSAFSVGDGGNPVGMRPEFVGLPVLESGRLRFTVRGVGRVRIETSEDLVVWTAVEAVTLESGVAKEWDPSIGLETFRAYRLVRE
jgi:hypothetical protein